MKIIETKGKVADSQHRPAARCFGNHVRYCR